MATETPKNLLLPIHLIKQLPIIAAWKDLNSKYIFMTQQASLLAGFKKPEEAVGLADHELRSDLSNLASTLREQDKKIIATAEPLMKVDIFNLNSCLRLLFVKKSPLYDENNNIIGVVCFDYDINDSALQQVLGILFNVDKYFNAKRQASQSYVVSANYNLNEISLRESECLFYFIRGVHYKKIADILGISRRTVEKNIDNIKIKLNCTSTTQLLELCVSNGLLNFIPKSFITKNVSIVIDNK